MNKKRIVIILMLIALISKFVGFFREVVLSYFWGASNISDAYLISTTIPTTVFAFIGAGITTGFIPIYTEVKEKQGRISSNQFINKILISTLSVCLVLIILGEVFCGLIVKVFASGFDLETYRIALSFTRVSLLEIGFSNIMYILTAYLQSEDSFIPVSLAAFPMNLMTIIAIALSSGGNYYFLCFGCLAASFVQAAFLVPFAIKKGFRLEKTKQIFNDKRIKEMFSLALPTIIGTSVNDINVLIDRTLASNLVVGGISALNYSSKINAFIQGIFVLTIVSYIYPKFSFYAVKKDYTNFESVVNKAVISISFIIIPASSIVFLYSKECVSIVFERGAFDEDAVRITASVLAMYSIGLFANGLREVFSRILFAYKDSKTPMINGAIGMVINIALNLVLSKFMGISGLALATTISSFCILFLLMFSVARKGYWRPNKQFSFTLIKLIVLSIILIVVIVLVNKGLVVIYQNINVYIRIGVSILIGSTVYLLGSFLLKVREVTDLFKSIKKLTKRGVNEVQ